MDGARDDKLKFSKYGTKGWKINKTVAWATKARVKN